MSRSREGTWLTTRSPILSRPSEMSSSPATIRSAVVFPQPDGPTSTMNSPSWASRSRSLTALVPSAKTFETSVNVTAATAQGLRYQLRGVGGNRGPSPREAGGPRGEAEGRGEAGQRSTDSRAGLPRLVDDVDP